MQVQRTYIRDRVRRGLKLKRYKRVMYRRVLSLDGLLLYKMVRYVSVLYMNLHMVHNRVPRTYTLPKLQRTIT